MTRYVPSDTARAIRLRMSRWIYFCMSLPSAGSVALSGPRRPVQAIGERWPHRGARAFCRHDVGCKSSIL
jgi:hypothetical protein